MEALILIKLTMQLMPAVLCALSPFRPLFPALPTDYRPQLVICIDYATM